MKYPPPGCDLTRTCHEIAADIGVSDSTAHRWKRQALIPMATGRKPNAKWANVTGEDWSKGVRHVASIVGVNISAAYEYGKRRGLIAQGAGGSRRKSVPEP